MCYIDILLWCLTIGVHSTAVFKRDDLLGHVETLVICAGSYCRDPWMLM